MCPSGPGQHASGMASAWSCYDFNMFGFNWASDCPCLSTVCQQQLRHLPDLVRLGCFCLPMSSGRSRAHLPRNERITLEVAIAIARPKLAANRSCSVQTWLCLPLTPWVHHEELPRYTGALLSGWTASCVHCTAAISPSTAASPLPFPGARDSAQVPPSEHMIPSLDK